MSLTDARTRDPYVSRSSRAFQDISADIIGAVFTLGFACAKDIAALEIHKHVESRDPVQYARLTLRKLAEEGLLQGRRVTHPLSVSGKRYDMTYSLTEKGIRAAADMRYNHTRSAARIYRKTAAPYNAKHALFYNRYVSALAEALRYKDPPGVLSYIGETEVRPLALVPKEEEQPGAAARSKDPMVSARGYKMLTPDSEVKLYESSDSAALYIRAYVEADRSAQAAEIMVHKLERYLIHLSNETTWGTSDTQTGPFGGVPHVIVVSPNDYRARRVAMAFCEACAANKDFYERLRENMLDKLNIAIERIFLFTSFDRFDNEGKVSALDAVYDSLDSKWIEAAFSGDDLPKLPHTNERCSLYSAPYTSTVQ